MKASLLILFFITIQSVIAQDSLQFNSTELVVLSAENTYEAQSDDTLISNCFISKTCLNEGEKQSILTFQGCDDRQILSAFSMSFYEEWLKGMGKMEAVIKAKKIINDKYPNNTLTPALQCTIKE